jgi:cold shock CspA family protein
MDLKMTTYVGSVRYWNRTRKFGFIHDDNSDVSHFVHVSELPSGVYDLVVGQKVRFGLRIDAKKQKEMACDVELVDE